MVDLYRRGWYKRKDNFRRDTEEITLELYLIRL